MDLFKSYLDNEISELQSGATDLSAYEGEQISLTATAEPEGEIGLVAQGTEGAVVLRADNSDGHIRLYADGTNGLVSISAIGTSGTVNINAETVNVNGTPIGASVPTPTTGDAGKVVTVNQAEDGYELDTPSGGGALLPGVSASSTSLDGAVVNTFGGTGFTAFAVGVSGEDHARLVLRPGGLYLGDGTSNPLALDNSIFFNGTRIGAPGDFDVGVADGGGVILKAPDDSLHRLKVGNDGSLTTEPVV